MRQNCSLHDLYLLKYGYETLLDLDHNHNPKSDFSKTTNKSFSRAKHDTVCHLSHNSSNHLQGPQGERGGNPPWAPSGSRKMSLRKKCLMFLCFKGAYIGIKKGPILS